MEGCQSVPDDLSLVVGALHQGLTRDVVLPLGGGPHVPSTAIGASQPSVRGKPSRMNPFEHDGSFTHDVDDDVIRHKRALVHGLFGTDTGAGLASHSIAKDVAGGKMAEAELLHEDGCLGPLTAPGTPKLHNIVERKTCFFLILLINNTEVDCSLNRYEQNSKTCDIMK